MNARKLQTLFSIKWNPFLPEVPVETLWVSARLALFCARLEHLVREGGFALISGDPGTGKSVALRVLAHHLGKLNDVAVGVILRPQSRLADFYRELGDIFGVPLAPHNRWCGFKSLREKWAAHLDHTLYRPVLLIDEAQEMNPTVLAELRLLTSADFDSRNLLTVVLCGDGRLLGQLNSAELLPVASRIRARLLLEPAPARDLGEMLRHVTEQAGNSKLITTELMTTLSDQSLGVPRTMMQMAHDLLLAGVEKERGNLDEKLYLDLFGQAREARSRGRAAHRP